jgi:cytochrome c556
MVRSRRQIEWPKSGVQAVNWRLPDGLAGPRFTPALLLLETRMKRLLLASIATLVSLTSLSAVAQFQKPEDAVKYRKAAFTVMSAHFGRIGAMASGRAPFDAAAAAANAEIVASMSKLPYAGFVEGTSGTDKGTPKANVWTERAKFDEDAKKMQDEVAKLAVVAKGGNLDQVKAAFGNAAASCKSCHDHFRNP